MQFLSVRSPPPTLVFARLVACLLAACVTGSPKLSERDASSSSRCNEARRRAEPHRQSQNHMPAAPSSGNYDRKHSPSVSDSRNATSRILRNELKVFSSSKQNAESQVREPLSVERSVLQAGSPRAFQMPVFTENRASCCTCSSELAPSAPSECRLNCLTNPPAVRTELRLNCRPASPSKQQPIASSRSFAPRAESSPVHKRRVQSSSPKNQTHTRLDESEEAMRILAEADEAIARLPQELEELRRSSLAAIAAAKSERHVTNRAGRRSSPVSNRIRRRGEDGDAKPKRYSQPRSSLVCPTPK